MTQHPETGREPHSGPPGLDPDQVDTETPDVNQPGEGCQVIETTTRDGQLVTFAVHTVAALTPAERAQLGAIAKTVAERELRENPHGGVLQALMTASLRAQVALRSAGAGDRADRLSAAVRSAAAVVRAAGADRESRFRWAEEAAELAARLSAELADSVRLPDDWRGRIRDCVNQQTANRLVALIESWRAPVPDWPCRCGTGETETTTGGDL